MKRKFAVLAEDDSDSETLIVIIRRLLDNPRESIASRQFGGCGNLLKDAHLHLQKFAGDGLTHFIICRDADGRTRDEVRNEFHQHLAKMNCRHLNYFIAVPTRTIEAWIIADHEAISKAIRLLVIKEEKSPEGLANPKEKLIKMSRRKGARPLYTPKIHNAKVAKHLNFDVFSKKCPSFFEFQSAIQSGTGFHNGSRLP